MFSRPVLGRLSSLPKMLKVKQLNPGRFRRVYCIKTIHNGHKWKVISAIFGAGGLILGVLGLENFYENVQAQEHGKRKIVVLGSGWGAVSFLKNLKPGVFDVAVVSPANYFLFTPFLPSVTVGTLEGRTIIEPIRKIIGRKHRAAGVKFFEAECYGIDAASKQVMCKDISGICATENSTFSLDYDILVVAVGAENNTFNIPGVKEYTHFLKEIRDAQVIRKNIMDSLETAAYPGLDEDEIKRLLHFVVIGGGPTGVEFAAELRDFLKKDLKKLYPDLVEKVDITLVDGYNKILSTYDEEISRYVESKFNKDNINVVTSTFVTGVNKKDIELMDATTKEKRLLPYGMCVWAAGIAPRQLTKDTITSISGQTNRNALLTDNFLQVKNAEGAFAIGDCATVEMKKMVHEVNELFTKADVNKNGKLSLHEFQAIMDDAKTRYPQVTLHFSKAFETSLKNAFKAADLDKDQGLSIEEFQKLLAKVDNQLKSLPATAQVAAQQGKYLGKTLSNYSGIVGKEINQDLGLHGASPFQYTHLGSFAYVGDNRAVLQLPIIGSFMGLSTMLMWRASYTSECCGFRMKTLVLFDWIKSSIFGRDTSRI